MQEELILHIRTMLRNALRHYHRRVKDVRVEQEDESESGVLNTGFNGKCPSVPERNLEQGTCAESDSQCEKIMNKYNKEYIFDTFHECINVVAES